MSSFGTSFSQPESFLVYANFSQGIKISYPATWRVQEKTDPAGFFVAFVSPAEDPADPFFENLGVVIVNLPQQVTLDAYVEFSLAQLQQFPLQLLESTRSTLGDMPAQRVLCAGPLPLPMGPFQGKYLGYWAVRGTKSVVATFTAQANKYEKFLPTIEQMVGSLEIR